jgi:hypothetical protein
MGVCCGTGHFGDLIVGEPQRDGHGVQELIVLAVMAIRIIAGRPRRPIVKT